MDHVLHLNKSKLKPPAEILVPGSKSESNRLLVLNSLYPDSINIRNLSDAEDTRLLRKALSQNSGIIDIHHAGTAMRFLTAYFSVLEGAELILTGSERMKQRPVGILVNALRSLGAEILYIEKEGFPPLKIKGKKITKNKVELDPGVSSQFVSALMLIAPKLENGLDILLNGKITSQPYVEMTAEILRKLGIRAVQKENLIRIEHKPEIEKQEWEVESDYSSASYFYSLATLAEKPEIIIGSFKKESLQGDARVAGIFNNFFGIESDFENNKIKLAKKPGFKPRPFEINLNDTPDLAQTIAVTAAGLRLKCKLTGLHTLRIKETDRLTALKNELEKVGTTTVITNDSIELCGFFETSGTPLIQTYNDHRMAMSFAALCLKGEIKIQNPEVVEKSYPNFWNDLNGVLN